MKKEKEFDINKEPVYCYDCAQKDIKKEIVIKNDEIIGGRQLFFETKEGKICIFKCDECFEKSQALENYQQCEVYARIVGYIRPVKQWHPGKQEEYAERVNFEINN